MQLKINMKNKSEIKWYKKYNKATDPTHRQTDRGMIDLFQICISIRER